jgi:hypothetical protein
VTGSVNNTVQYIWLRNDFVSLDNQFAYDLGHLHEELTPGYKCYNGSYISRRSLQKQATCILVPVQTTFLLTLFQTGIRASTPHCYFSIASVSSVCFAKNFNLANINLLEGSKDTLAPRLEELEYYLVISWEQQIPFFVSKVTGVYILYNSV